VDLEVGHVRAVGIARTEAQQLVRHLDDGTLSAADHRVLVVRRLEVRERSASARHRRAQAQLSDLGRRAWRPAHGPIPPTAEAVVFEDEAQLLACVTEDMIRGNSHRWYWQELLRGLPSDPGRALAPIWLRRIRWLPAALVQLDQPTAAAAVALVAGDAGQVLKALLAAFDVQSVDNWRAPPRASAPVRAKPAWDVPVPDGGIDRAHAARSTRAMPWDGLVPRGDGAALLQLATALAHDPAEVRRRVTTALSPSPAAAQPTPGVGAHRSRRPDSFRARAAPEPTDIHDPATVQPAASTSSSWMTDGLVTELAGLLFLVNFVVWLAPFPVAISGWGIVELLARHLIGTKADIHRQDALWGLLAALDGRAVGSPLTVTLAPRDTLRLPDAWLTRWPPPRLTASLEGGDRLLVTSDQGPIVVADVPGSDHAGLLAETARLRRMGLDVVDGLDVTDGDSSAGPTPLARLERSVGGFVSWLLQDRAITVEALACPGRVALSRTHLDLTIDWDDLDLPIRRAGLDCDPGWVPDLGRIVLFHFGSDEGA
jgi:hypothetical protein